MILYFINFWLWAFRSYQIHQRKLQRIKEELDKNKNKKVGADTSYEHLKSQMTNNKLKSHEFTETGKKMLNIIY